MARDARPVIGRLIGERRVNGKVAERRIKPVKKGDTYDVEIWASGIKSGSFDKRPEANRPPPGGVWTGRFEPVESDAKSTDPV